MSPKSKEENLRQLGSCYEVLSAAVEFDRTSRNTLKIQREALRLKQTPGQAPPERSE